MSPNIQLFFKVPSHSKMLSVFLSKSLLTEVWSVHLSVCISAQMDVLSKSECACVTWFHFLKNLGPNQGSVISFDYSVFRLLYSRTLFLPLFSLPSQIGLFVLPSPLFLLPPRLLLFFAFSSPPLLTSFLLLFFFHFLLFLPLFIW